MSLVKQLTTVSEFERWQAYFEKKRSLHSKSDWYAAQVAWAVFASQGADKTKREDFLLSYEPPKRKRKAPVNPEEAWKQSQAMWLGMLGIDPEITNG